MYAALLAGDRRRPRAFVLMAATPRWGDWFLPFWPVSGERWAYLRDMEELDPITHIARAAPAPVLFQFARHDYFIAGMTGREFHAAAGEPKELRAYDAEHRLDDAAQVDRLAFLERVLELPPR
jgi:hypothetical protein